ncbi:MAG: SRPBCC family protein [bacterium]
MNTKLKLHYGLMSLIIIPSLIFSMQFPNKAMAIENITRLQKGEVALRFFNCKGDLKGTEGKVLIHSSPEKVWALLENQERMGRIVPGVRQNKILAKGHNFQKVQVSLKTAPALPVFQYTLHLDENERTKTIIYKRTEGSFKELYGSWEIEPYQGNSILTYTMYIDLGFYLPSFLRSYGLNNTLPTTLKAIKNELEKH